MSTLTVWKFPSPFGADTGELRLKALRDQGAIVIHDAAVVVWRPEDKQPKVREFRHKRGHKALGGTFWGTLIGSVVLMPVAGAAVGAATGELVGKLHDSGIDEAFVRRLREQLSPGCSALFVLSSEADMDRVKNAFHDEEAELIWTDLSPEQEAELRELTGTDDSSDSS
jgi:uncharacterized membrane protein